MTRLTIRGQSFLGSPLRSYAGPWEIDGRKVGRVEFRIAHARAFRREAQERRFQISRAPGVRARKHALDRRQPLRGCEHEFEYHEDTMGDYIYWTTVSWLECCACGAQRAGDWRDALVHDDCL